MRVYIKYIVVIYTTCYTLCIGISYKFSYKDILYGGNPGVLSLKLRVTSLGDMSHDIVRFVTQKGNLNFWEALALGSKRSSIK